MSRGMDARDRGTVTTYLNSLRHYDQLKHPEVVSLFQAYEAGGPAADKARKRLIECNLRLVVSIARQYSGNDIPIEDLIQEGNIGLMRAIERFKWDKGYRFSTYATWWIKQAIGQHVLKRKRIIRLPAHAATVQRKMLRATQEFKDEFDREPTQDELIELIGASKTVVRATVHGGKGTVSLQQPISIGNPDGDSLEDRLIDDRLGSDPFENVASKQLLEAAQRVLASLSSKEVAILRLRFGLVEDPTDDERFPITEGELEDLRHGRGLTNKDEDSLDE